MNASDLRHAYAVLGLSPPLTEAALKRRYKSLARRWHPDRYQADPVGQAEANEKLRDINIAYEIVAASLQTAEPPPVVRTEPSVAQPFSLSREQIDAIVDSINRGRRVDLLPEMSIHRWLSIAAIFVYMIGAIILFQVDPLVQSGIFRAVGAMSGYLWLPLYLIWTGDNDSRSSFECSLYRIMGWLLMALPAVLITSLLIAA